MISLHSFGFSWRVSAKLQSTPAALLVGACLIAHTIAVGLFSSVLKEGTIGVHLCSCGASMYHVNFGASSPWPSVCVAVSSVRQIISNSLIVLVWSPEAYFFARRFCYPSLFLLTYLFMNLAKSAWAFLASLSSSLSAYRYSRLLSFATESSASFHLDLNLPGFFFAAFFHRHSSVSTKHSYSSSRVSCPFATVFLSRQFGSLWA